MTIQTTNNKYMHIYLILHLNMHNFKYFNKEIRKYEQLNDLKILITT